MRATTLVPLLILAPLAGQPLGKVRIFPPPERPYPNRITAAVNAWNHARWPVRAQLFDRIEWQVGCGHHTGMALPTADGRRIFVQGEGGGLRQVNGSNGNVLWTGPRARGANYSSAICAKETFYGSSYDSMRALDARGRKLWETPLQAHWLNRPPALSPNGAHLFVGGSHLEVACLATKTGKLLWQHGRLHGQTYHHCFDPLGNLLIQMQHKLVSYSMAGKKLWSIDEHVDGMMLVGPKLICHAESRLKCRDLDTGKWEWSKDLGLWIEGIALGNRNSVVCAFNNGDLKAFDLRGKRLWRCDLSTRPLGKPVVTIDGEIVVQDADGFVYLYSPRQRKVLAVKTTGGKPSRWRPVLGPRGRVFIADRHALVCLSATDRKDAKTTRRLTTVTDDFIVDVWVNGKRLPDSERQMLWEIFGATCERITVNLRKGDWIVFNVANNRLRWGGVCYFGVYGANDAGEQTFVSKPDKSWSYCDDTTRVADFIAKRDFGTKQLASVPENEWPDGKNRFRALLGKDFPGKPLWGKRRNTWVKHVVQ